ncbi:hypothetical protein Bpfe_025385 [Biomphalaria pfeifferi]|uniref:Uncharacterized protein n=1 Tax=Biomphalaria pfeifferi TaxID=112525 RepID=A0AAD8AZC4_BIOPF|nr:hypothetical protein Bpfe_025385 [Biomphalaria pfeifferi]
MAGPKQGRDRRCVQGGEGAGIFLFDPRADDVAKIIDLSQVGVGRRGRVTWLARGLWPTSDQDEPESTKARASEYTSIHSPLPDSFPSPFKPQHNTRD